MEEQQVANLLPDDGPTIDRGAHMMLTLPPTKLLYRKAAVEAAGDPRETIAGMVSNTFNNSAGVMHGRAPRGGYDVAWLVVACEPASVDWYTIYARLSWLLYLLVTYDHTYLCTTDEAAHLALY
jgi:hypothetical protein